MGHLQVKNVPEDLHAELRRRAELGDMTVRDYVLALIRKDQQVPTLEEWLESLPRSLTGVESVDAARLVREGRDERARELARRTGRGNDGG